MKWGEDYNELHQVISVVICDHVFLEDEPSYINCYELRNEANHSFTNLFKLVILELPKLPEEDGSRLWPWLRFLKSTKKEEFEMLARRYPELERPIDCAKKLSLGERWRDYWFHEHLRRMDNRALREQWRIDGLAEGRAEGRAEGHAEGIAEGRAEGMQQGMQQGIQQGEKNIINLLKSGKSSEEIIKLADGLAT
jgi:predicted transposase/invertase (TIGR01784 family)